VIRLWSDRHIEIVPQGWWRARELKSRRDLRKKVKKNSSDQKAEIKRRNRGVCDDTSRAKKRSHPNYETKETKRAFLEERARRSLKSTLARGGTISLRRRGAQPTSCKICREKLSKHTRLKRGRVTSRSKGGEEKDENSRPPRREPRRSNKGSRGTSCGPHLTVSKLRNYSRSRDG